MMLGNILSIVMTCAGVASLFRLMPYPGKKEELHSKNKLLNEGYDLFSVPEASKLVSKYIPILGMGVCTLIVSDDWDQHKLFVICLCYCLCFIIRYVAIWKSEPYFLIREEGIYIYPFHKRLVEYSEITPISIKKPTSLFSFNRGDYILKVNVQGKKYNINLDDEYDVVDNICRYMQCKVQVSVQKKYYVAGMVITALSIVAVLAFGIITAINLNFLGHENRNYEVILEKDVPAGAELDAVIHQGNTYYGLYDSYGQVSIYDEEGAFKYAYGVPIGKSGTCEFTISGGYVILMNRDGHVFVYRDKLFVEETTEKRAKRKYNIEGYADWEDEKTIEQLQKILLQKRVILSEEGALTMLLISIIATIIGESILRKREKYRIVPIKE